MIPTWFGVIATLLAAIAWPVFAHVRRQPGLSWLGLPFLLQAVLYIWFTITDVPVELRAAWARPSIVLLSLTQGVALLGISLVTWRRNGKR